MATFEERIASFVWQANAWVAPKQGRDALGRFTSETVYDVLFRQRFTGAEVQIEDEPDIGEPPGDKKFIEYKAYIVWYSGKNYEVRREISVRFWLRSTIFPSESIGEDLLKRAVERCGFERSYEWSEAQGWADANGNYEYIVPVASFGRKTTDLLPSEYERTEYRYTKKGSKIQGGSIQNFHNG